MTSKLAIKTLTASDLTLFQWQFRNRNAGNQKAINLNADVFVEQLYPVLTSTEIGKAGRIPLDLYLYGPGLAGEHNLQRKIIKLGTYKNWRLNGEFIFNPDDSPERFNVLAPDDYAVFDFEGELCPTAARIVLVSRVTPEDGSLHNAIGHFMGGKRMAALSSADLGRIIQNAHPQPQHPIHELLLDSALEDAAYSGTQGLRTLQARPSGRKMSQAELERARQSAEEVGRQGEEYVNEYLTLKQSKGSIQKFTWVASENAVAPYDFLVSEDGATNIMVEAKSTSGEFHRMIHVSMNELLAMSSGEGRFDLYRIYEIGSDGAKLRIAHDVSNFARNVLESFSRLPDGVQVDSISISPSVIPFERAFEVLRPLGEE